jgi:hypothetical protein
MFVLLAILFNVKYAPRLPDPLIVETEKYLRLFAPLFWAAGTVVLVVYGLAQL